MSRKEMKMPQLLVAAAIMSAVWCGTAFAGTAGWAQENGEWVYLDRNGDRVTDSWKKNAAGTFWFYLDGEGYMARNQVIQTDDNYYYVNEDGARVSNEWRKVEDDSGSDAYTDGQCWYYFGKNGRAQVNTSGKTKLTAINGKKYAFDEEGRMLYGWVASDGNMVTEEDDWANGTYYCGDEDDGAAVLSSWQLVSVNDEEADDHDDADGNYWFYFGASGKKTTDTKKKINKLNYEFDDRGVAQYEWYMASASSVASGSSYQYFNDPTQCWRADGWFKVVPSEEVDAKAYNDDEEKWFYADSKGNLAKSQIKTINKQKYGFNENGVMLEGLYALTFGENNKIESYQKIEDIADMPDEDEDEIQVYYFGNSPKDGAMSTSKSVKVALDDDTYDFGFKSRGECINGISDNYLYIKGRKRKADSNDKLAVVTFKGENYLVNTSGVVQKKKTNIKDADETYYCTDSRGVVTYQDGEKKK